MLPASYFLRALIPPYFLVEMISKLFLIQAFVALLIIALTSPVNAAAIAPGRQFLFLVLIDREDLC